MSKVLVTGGAGFIGSHLVEALVQQGHQVVVIDNLSSGRLSNLSNVIHYVDFRHQDIRNLGAVRSAMEGVEVVFHEAALGSVPRSLVDPETTNDVNVKGTLNVLIAAKDAGVRRVVYAASSSAYGDTLALPKIESMRLLPLSPYAASKLAGEMYMLAFFRSYGLETISLRYFNVFGPRQDPDSRYAAVIPRFITAALAGVPATINGDGEQTRDFTYVDNVVHANLLAFKTRTTSGEAINVGCGERISLNNLLRLISDLVGTRCSAVHVSARAGDVRHSLADVSLAEQLIGYRPVVSLKEGIARTVEWYRHWIHMTAGGRSK